MIRPNVIGMVVAALVGQAQYIRKKAQVQEKPPELHPPTPEPEPAPTPKAVIADPRRPSRMLLSEDAKEKIAAAEAKRQRKMAKRRGE